MYTKISCKSYRNFPYNDEAKQLACCPNYVYNCIDKLAKQEAPDNSLEYYRTVGILQSCHGHFYACQINSNGGVDSDIKIQVSLVYLKTPPQIVGPYPVQIFGTMRWLNGKPVLFVKLLQVLSIRRALQMNDAMNLLVSRHSCKVNN